MKKSLIISSVAGLLTISTASAQCFNRTLCDPSVLEVHSQISVNVPVPPATASDAALKATEEARKQLYTLASRECETLHQIFGGDCTLSSININSSLQDRGNGANVAFVSISNTYVVKRGAK